MQLPQLPIHAVLPDLKNALQCGSVVLTAPPGSGKTTIVPLTLLDEPWLQDKKIIILEPRRLATRAAATRMATLLGESIGQTVGYHIRFDRRVSDATRIEVVTEGILTRRIQNDNELQNTGLIIFDEFHERSIHGDLALALCLDLCQLRENLRILTMSATLDTGPIAKLMGNIPVVQGEGRSYPVAIEYLSQPTTGRIADITTAGIRRVFQKDLGDVLAFLPGAGEIKDVAQRLKRDPVYDKTIIAPLYGNLSKKEQDQAITPDPSGLRRIILSTSIAETSLTIEGIGCVVDSGWSRRSQFNQGNGLTRLTTVRVSKAVAEQRAGRAGRLGPGYCLRLWTKEEQYSLAPFHPPEIVETDLAQLALELALWGVSNPSELLWITPPRTNAYQKARELLYSLDAVTKSGRITATGKKLASLGVHPRLGHMLLKGRKTGQTSLACDLAALLSERDIIRGKAEVTTTDVQDRLHLLSLWRKKKSIALQRKGCDASACNRVEKNARIWLQRMNEQRKPYDPEEAGLLLAYAYPDRVARRRHDRQESYLMASGRGVKLPKFDPLLHDEYLVVPLLDAGIKDGRIFLAAPITIEALRINHEGLFSTTNTVYWDDESKKVMAVDRLCLGSIVVDEKPAINVSPEQVTQALLAGIERMGIDCLPWSRDARQLQARINCLRSWQPDGDWPDLSNRQLLSDLSWLEPYLLGIRKAEQLQQLNLKEIMMTMLGWKKMQCLEQLAPITITVPSGSKIRLRYKQDEPPLLAVRIQEMFGCQETPLICNGKVPVLLHLLSPAQRPLQVTTDLARFWRRIYPEVKKELKGRYPKHYWPDDPVTATATKRTKKYMDQMKGK